MARTEDPRTAPPIRWGILGAGNIAASFADAVREHTRAQLVAVGSRNRDRAERFATAHGIPTTHVGYRQLVEDPQVDAVYVATPHSEHRENALLAIRAGKHLLVEKAFTRNAAEAREVFDAAREAGVFVMEAMWTRFLPHVAALHQVIDAGEIGDVVNVSADHGQAFAFDPASRLFAPELAGGALLDLGVYPVSFAHDLLGVPDAVRAVGALTETGVDGQVSIVLSFGERAQATLSTTLWAKTPTVALISGTEGHIQVAGSFYAPTSFRVQRTDGRVWTFDQPGRKGLQFEAAEVARRVAAGETESPRLTWADTLAVMETMDEVRRQVGVVYPGE
ncbi:Gfo/Idh/MocA family protein [Cellulomonas fimi]|uniref:Oxidoreductase domain protein n=1 Tax=Cellulomonas fimi (strain ATCC 484 / DSM 20113 / JCM 1341 / CCUG 24087 / LMG 16345 / NBRC 15513 / NCIMB 8980 / NCTC 7547 / NRS-133) TaxID=590998 RepID=F4H864_CELFA|nr:Gfo/Idh/MocA family oxidoreductase [Cellulomonas fimi]AEE44621.1 oxidoreductase domain protein [Cellulomonas fimi ATCC 484]NNH08780.1 Gfo/Idh/MocA family oxidoreductase [Cellulomonas fimi]VEH26807.1 1,5-anhydro-D-fructose reductase [Cellulomonas fimi]